MTDCVFCARIAAGEYDHMNDGVYDFEPLDPVTPGHRLFVPLDHVIDAQASPYWAGRTVAIASIWTAKTGEAFNLITSAGSAATQTVLHLHVHYVPRRVGDGLLLPWGTK